MVGIVKQDKYIDLNQFPLRNNKNISWKDSVGIIAEFFYNGERHELEILEHWVNSYGTSRLKIRVDDVVLDDVGTHKITRVNFGDLFYQRDYAYNVGDIVNNLLILEQCLKERVVTYYSGKTTNAKAYLVKCLKDGYEFVTEEDGIKHGKGCPVCAHNITVVGINDIATTNPDLIMFFVNKEDAYKYSRCSNAVVNVKCSDCGFVKQMMVSELTKRGHVTCDRCSDGVSYPNKFARELFSQLRNQYLYYEHEFSPNWANRYSYDIYVKLLDGTEIVVEIDGQFHYKDKYGGAYCNDSKKDSLCAEHGIVMIRVDCNYDTVDNRYSYIKNNIENSLNGYFDLSNIDWNKCNQQGISSYVKTVVNYYNDNPTISIPDIAKHFNLNRKTAYSYINIGESLGWCDYIRNDPNRIKKRQQEVA